MQLNAVYALIAAAAAVSVAWNLAHGLACMASGDRRSALRSFYGSLSSVGAACVAALILYAAQTWAGRWPAADAIGALDELATAVKSYLTAFVEGEMAAASLAATADVILTGLAGPMAPLKLMLPLGRIATAGLSGLAAAINRMYIFLLVVRYLLEVAIPLGWAALCLGCILLPLPGGRRLAVTLVAWGLVMGLALPYAVGSALYEVKPRVEEGLAACSMSYGALYVEAPPRSLLILRARVPIEGRSAGHVYALEVGGRIAIRVSDTGRAIAILPSGNYTLEAIVWGYAIFRPRREVAVAVSPGLGRLFPDREEAERYVEEMAREIFLACGGDRERVERQIRLLNESFVTDGRWYYIGYPYLPARLYVENPLPDGYVPIGSRCGGFCKLEAPRGLEVDVERRDDALVYRLRAAPMHEASYQITLHLFSVRPSVAVRAEGDVTASWSIEHCAEGFEAVSEEYLREVAREVAFPGSLANRTAPREPAIPPDLGNYLVVINVTSRPKAERVAVELVGECVVGNGTLTVKWGNYTRTYRFDEILSVGREAVIIVGGELRRVDVWARYTIDNGSKTLTVTWNDVRVDYRFDGIVEARDDEVVLLRKRPSPFEVMIECPSDGWGLAEIPAGGVSALYSKAVRRVRSLGSPVGAIAAVGSLAHSVLVNFLIALMASDALSASLGGFSGTRAIGGRLWRFTIEAHVTSGLAGIAAAARAVGRASSMAGYRLARRGSGQQHFYLTGGGGLRRLASRAARWHVSRFLAAAAVGSALARLGAEGASRAADAISRVASRAARALEEGAGGLAPVLAAARRVEPLWREVEGACRGALERAGLSCEGGPEEVMRATLAAALSSGRLHREVVGALTRALGGVGDEALEPLSRLLLRSLRARGEDRAVYSRVAVEIADALAPLLSSDAREARALVGPVSAAASAIADGSWERAVAARDALARVLGGLGGGAGLEARVEGARRASSLLGREGVARLLAAIWTGIAHLDTEFRGRIGGGGLMTLLSMGPPETLRALLDSAPQRHRRRLAEDLELAIRVVRGGEGRS